MRFFLVIGLCLAKLVYADSVVTTGNIRVTSSSYFKGAISSVKYKGIELINSADRGRLLQSAVSFDGMGECLNPTERKRQLLDNCRRITPRGYQCFIIYRSV